MQLFEVRTLHRMGKKAKHKTCGINAKSSIGRLVQTLKWALNQACDSAFF
jgi:hypothetical protein